jgi:hypothetical protein
MYTLFYMHVHTYVINVYCLSVYVVKILIDNVPDQSVLQMYGHTDAKTTTISWLVYPMTYKTCQYKSILLSIFNIISIINNLYHVEQTQMQSDRYRVGNPMIAPTIDGLQMWQSHYHVPYYIVIACYYHLQVSTSCTEWRCVC